MVFLSAATQRWDPGYGLGYSAAAVGFVQLDALI